MCVYVLCVFVCIHVCMYVFVYVCVCGQYKCRVQPYNYLTILSKNGGLLI